MSRHRLERVRPRYGRIAAAVVSVLVTFVALLGGMGLLPEETPIPSDADVAAVGAPLMRAEDGVAEPSAEPARLGRQLARASHRVSAVTAAKDPLEGAPPKSGEGRRVVFSEAEQRVWLVDEDDEVIRSYLVSGSVYDNLDPGTYEVYSRSEQAYGIDDSGTMKWFVRFTTGDNAAIGFHDIPVDGGAPVQTEDELGSPLSHGCIRQKESDAIALWEFAPIGTTVVVV